MHEIFLEIARDPIGYLQSWAKGSTRELALTFSGLFPLELLDAMGFHGVWLPPVLRNRYNRADTMLQVFMCSRARSFVDVVAGSELPVAAIGAVTDCDAKDVIPGVLHAGGCETPVVTLRMPIRVDTPAAVDFAVNGVRHWVAEAEHAFNRRLDPDLLAGACALRLRTRQRLSEMFQKLGTEVDPVFAYSAAVSAQVMEPEAFLHALDAAPWPKPDHKRRMIPVLMSGSELPNIKIIEDLAGLGALIVLDDTETGTRAASRPVQHPGCQDAETPPPPDLDGLLEAIGAGIVYKKHGPTKVSPAGNRIQGIVSAALDRGVQAAVLGLFKFCDPHAFEAPALIEQLKMAGIHSIVVETDKETGLLARERTRLQTLLEIVE